ncbi:MAG: DnaJ domain-containing protein [Leptospiraceae bacterium]|nr:DnaJ domain-containing protein [Leptospiraceae bacterium]MDW7977011.1 DnaJ domain-containing protein [Leptospiraceae bacterium]
MERIIDHYGILGIPRGSSIEEIKKAFWKWAKIYHPDKKGDPEKFYQLYTSYKFLSDPIKKKEYDLLLQKHNSKESTSKETYYVIDARRLIYTATLKKFIEENINLKTIKGKERKFLAKITYDYIVLLNRNDFYKNLLLPIPMIFDRICEYCHGSDLYCSYCDGRGYRKTNGNVYIKIQKCSLQDLQILNVSLKEFKHPTLRARIKEVKVLIRFV